MNKECRRCKSIKGLSEFARNKNCADGHLTICKECNDMYRRAHSEERRVAALRRRRAQGIVPKRVFATDQERTSAHLEACVRWQQRNRKAYDEYQRQYHQSNKQERLRRASLWRETHKHVINAGTSRRRASVQQAVPLWVDYRKIIDIYELSQALTTMTGIQHQVDHYYPLNGKYVCGLHVHDNLRVITREENQAKGNKMPSE